MIQYLVSQGADVDAIDDKTTSCGDKFMVVVLSRGLPEDQYGPLLQYFRTSSYVEDGEHTLLHRIVFGNSSLPLEQVLQDSPEIINKPDAYGRTPLEWASARGDEDAVRTLLKYKADPNIVAQGGWGPLHSAMLTECPEITRLLLEHGADPNHPSDIFLERPLHIAVRFERLRGHSPVLFQYGADASLATKVGILALTHAAVRDYPLLVELLVKETPRELHIIACIAAIKQLALRALGELLKQGAELAGSDHTGKTVWHYAAEGGNIQVVQLLRTAKYLPSIHLRDHAGLTAKDIATEKCQEILWLEVWNALECCENETQSE
jgi:ankyrin repeat protein